MPAHLSARRGRPSQGAYSVLDQLVSDSRVE